jgi:hypothetical protein
MADEVPVPDAAAMKQRRKVSVIVVVGLVVIMVLATLIPLLRLLEFEEGNTYVINVKVDIDLDVGTPYIQSIRPSIQEIEILDEVRADVIIYPGVPIRVMKGDDFLSYESFAEYTGSGTYNITTAFRTEPKIGDRLNVVAFIYEDPNGGYHGDNHGVRLVWKPGFQDSQSLSLSVEANGTANKKIQNVTISQGGRYNGAAEAPYPGLHCFARKDGKVVSPEMGVHYDSGTGTYQIELPLYTDVNTGDELTVFVEVWEIFNVAYTERFEVTYVWE